MTKNVVVKNWVSFILSWTDGTKRSYPQPVSGLLAAGHYLARIQPLVEVYPRPDSETGAYARHHWAFYDGSHPMLFDLPIDVIGGSYPHVPVLVAGPGITGNAGVGTMQIVMPNYAAGPPYASPRLQWTPTGAWSGTVTIRWYSQEYQTDTTQYIDQSFTLQTSGDISQGGVFIFANKDTGSASNSGSYASPIDDMPTACGTTYAAAPTIGGVATAGKILVLMGSTAEYTLPLYSDGNGSGTYFQVNKTLKPMAIIGFPGQLPKFSAALAYGGAAVATDVILTDGNSGDFFLGNLNPDGYNTTSGSGGSFNTRLVYISGSGDNRITVDSVQWTNSGWGGQSGGGQDNSSIVTTEGFSTGLRQYIYVNNCSEPSRQSGNSGNNFAGPDFYNVQYSLVQGYTCNNPGASYDSGCFLKVDCENSEVRGCYYNCAVLYPCSFGEGSHEGFQYNDSTFNLLIGVQNLNVPQLNSGTILTGLLRAARNSIVASSTGLGIGSKQANSGGPYMVDSNAVQGASVALPTGTSITNDGLNQFASSGILNASTGLLINGANVGLVGAQVA